MIAEFNIEKEWNFLSSETILKAPQRVLAAIWTSNRELLLKAQVLLAKVETEYNNEIKTNLINEYLLTIHIYNQNNNGRMN
jgi:hypothetical protein